MATVLVTGANRGLGLEFCKQYASEGWRMLACCRMPQAASELTSLAERYPQVSVFALDVADFAQIERLAAQLQDTSIDVLINNAGVYGIVRGEGSDYWITRRGIKHWLSMYKHP